MTDPERERIEALIESLDTTCDIMKPAGLGRYVGRIREAIEQLRADHPAQGERTGDDLQRAWQAGVEALRNTIINENDETQGYALAVESGYWDGAKSYLQRVQPLCIHASPAPARTEATPAEQGGNGATAAADRHASDCATHNMPAMPNGPCNCGFRPSLAEMVEAVEWAECEYLGANAPSDTSTALSAAAAMLAAMPATEGALKLLVDSAEAFIGASSPVVRTALHNDITAARAVLRALRGEQGE